MSALWLLLGAVALSALASADHHCVCPGGREWGQVVSKARAQEDRINRLAGRVETIADKLRTGGERVKKFLNEFRELEYRVDELAGKSYLIFSFIISFTDLLGVNFIKKLLML